MAFTAPPAARAADQLVLQRLPGDQGAATVKLGMQFPSAWSARLGVDLGMSPAQAGAGASRLADTPPNRLWGRVSLPAPDSRFGWSSASLNAGVNAADRSMHIGADAARKLSLGDGIAATIATSTTLNRPDIDAAAALNWQAGGSLRLTAEATGTSFVASNNFASADGIAHAGVEIDQHVAGKVNFVTAVSDLQSGDPAARFTLNLNTKW
jgi:hypothetical protein